MRHLAAISLLAALLVGCGQTGPLYLPGEADKESSQEKPAPTAAPATEESTPEDN